jgi:hypothetical protein
MPATKVRRKRKSSSRAKSDSADGAMTPSSAKTVNASAAVRKYVKKHPEAMPKQISAALAKRGIDVKPNYVSIIKSKFLAATGEAAGGEPGGAPARKGKSTGQKYDLDDLMVAKKFAQQIGGVDRAKEVINAIAKLQ